MNYEQNRSIAWQLEPFLISPKEWGNHKDEWQKLMPESIFNEVFSDEPQCIGVGLHEEIGLFVLASGQGPFIAWTQIDHNELVKIWKEHDGILSERPFYV